jgi:hypothetical protein
LKFIIIFEDVHEIKFSQSKSKFHIISGKGVIFERKLRFSFVKEEFDEFAKGSKIYKNYSNEYFFGQTQTPFR